MIQATVAVYPLGQARFAAVDAAIERLGAPGLDVTVRSMATEISGDEALVFAVLREAFDAAAAHGGVVMTVTLSNACPPSQSGRA